MSIILIVNETMNRQRLVSAARAVFRLLLGALFNSYLCHLSNRYNDEFTRREAVDVERCVGSMSAVNDPMR